MVRLSHICSWVGYLSSVDIKDLKTSLISDAKKRPGKLTHEGEFT